MDAATLRGFEPMPELLLARAGLSPELRGEALSVAEFANLAILLDNVRASKV